jgi:hypothetical protein
MVLEFAACEFFIIKWLVRYARRERITDRSLSEAIGRAARGLIDADLGGGIIKQNILKIIKNLQIRLLILKTKIHYNKILSYN